MSALLAADAPLLTLPAVSDDAPQTYGRASREIGPRRSQWILDVKPHIAIRLKRMFSRIETARTGRMTVADTTEFCRDLAWVLDRWPLDMSPEDRAYLHARSNEHQDTEKAARAVLTGRAQPLDTARTSLRDPRAYQALAADLALTTGRLLIVDDLGLGKTMTGLTTLKSPDALPALVVCPTHLATQWLDELASTWDDLVGYEVTSRTPYDLAGAADGKTPDVVVVPYSKIATWADMLAGNVKTVIFDEIQDLRRPDSAKYQGAARVANDATVRVGLTATPCYNYGSEIHAVIDVLAPGALGTLAEFNREWQVSPKGQVKDPIALGEYLRDQSLMIVRTRADVGREIAEPISITQSVDADESALETAIGDASEMARLILSATASPQTKFKASGDLDWRMRQATGIAKAGFVAEFVRLLAETEQKIVLFGWHRPVYDLWAERLADLNPVFYTGHETPAHKHRSKEAFINGDARVLAMSLRSGAGLDGLQKVASTAVFGELDWSPKVHDQCVGRLWREGQESAVVAYYCVSDSGADPVMAEVNNLKNIEANALVHAKTPGWAVAQNHADRIRRLAESVIASKGGAVADTPRMTVAADMLPLTV